MEIRINEINRIGIAELIADRILIAGPQEALEIMMNCKYRGADAIILRRHHLTPVFFDLKTRVAGEILQKFSTYSMKLAIVGDFSDLSSKSLRDFIYESNKQGRVNFAASVEDALKALSR